MRYKELVKPQKATCVPLGQGAQGDWVFKCHCGSFKGKKKGWGGADRRALSHGGMSQAEPGQGGADGGESMAGKIFRGWNWQDCGRIRRGVASQGTQQQEWEV